MLISLISFSLFFTAAVEMLSAVNFFDDAPPTELARSIVAEMSDSEAAGQLLLLGYFGSEPSREIVEWVDRYGIGGIKIFGWNAGNLLTLGNTISSLQRLSNENRFSIPLFVATDQEGGWVRHVKGETSVTPGNLAIGASGLPYDAYRTGYHIGRELRVLGINLNFAPTVDIYTNPDAAVIGPRAFSTDPVQTAQLSVAYYRGMEESGIICTAKHYPGHGATAEDSHGTLPVINADMDTIWNRELIPYRFLIREGLPAIMSGHIAYPLITGTGEPASTSRILLTDILRERLGFKGLIITDDMQMNGANIRGGIPEASLQAVLAGNDVIMISRDTEIYQRTRTRLLAEMKVSPDSAEIIRRAATRIIETKLRYLKKPGGVPLFPDADTIRSAFPNEDSRSFFRSQAYRSVSVMKNGNIPLERDNTGRVLLAGQLSAFLSIGSDFFPEADRYSFDYSPFFSADSQVMADLKNRTASYDTVIFCLANPNSAQVLEALKGIDAEIYVISVLTPIYLQRMSWVENAIAVYGTGDESLEAGFSALTGAFTPTGTFPGLLEIQ
jgi:beta-N-acetylhexosaminidase